VAGGRRSQKPWSPLQRRQVDDLIFYAALGVMLGGAYRLRAVLRR
jgi:prolipoprotein diacylglyceryltransferase